MLHGMSARSFAIRPWTAGDGKVLFEAVFPSRIELARWLPWCRPDYARAEAEAYTAGRAAAWSAGADFSFAITDESDDRIVGGCGLHEISRLNRTASLGYWVRTDATGRGAASTGARILARFGFIHLALDRIEIIAAVGNIASQRAAQKAGAHREGVLRNRLRIQDTPTDAVVFSLLPADLGL